MLPSGTPVYTRRASETLAGNEVASSLIIWNHALLFRRHTVMREILNAQLRDPRRTSSEERPMRASFIEIEGRERGVQISMQSRFGTNLTTC